MVVEATKNNSGYACALKQHRHDRLNCGNSDLLQIVKRLEEISAGLSEPNRGDRHDHPGRPDAHAGLGKLRGIRKRNDPRENQLGLARARLEGRVGDNRASLTPKQQAHALAIIDEGKSQSEVAEVLRVYRSTICQLVAERRVVERA